MNRTIVSDKDIDRPPADLAGGDSRRSPLGSPPKQADAYADKLLKLIPAEIVALWVTLRGILATADTAPIWLQWASFLIVLALTPLYLRRAAGVTKMVQIAITTGAFAVWVFSLGGAPFATLPSAYSLPVYGAVLLPLYTFAAPLLNVD